ncbi:MULTISPECIES: formate dehydrogenase subunit delta [unclassified Plantactinospora]|uniref:formate dehydrogenase subunit delta n=1 Tax=unclassified Plantactinospora TaxID=2631981 RepID=UPI000D15CD8A|nr:MULTISPECIES: formate dehydrogenase subunit delta [unclassified Plantactinospora]AVT29621.1 formate dehydrogenase [Plantactinospora sp. BC1]AVT36029.1 formate dehydrogenase [Plantactinospora sp. BB1]
MSTHTGTSPQVRLANEIAVHFRHQAPEQAAAAIAEHIRAFWDPRMRAELLARAEAEPDAFDPLALAAARLLTG